MVKIRKRILAALLTAAMLIMLLPLSVFAETHENQVHVVVENMTYKMEQGAPWEGTKIDTWVTIESSSTALSVLETAVGTGNLDAVAGYYGTYINGIYGITNGDGGTIGEYGWNPAGWMFEINGTMASSGISNYTVSAGTLSGGDELVFEYSLDGGPDIGYDYSDTEKKALKSLEVSDGVLSPEFRSGQTSYTLTIPSDTESIVLSPEAENKTETITVSVGDTEYKRALEIPVDTGTQISIVCSNGTEETTYTLYVKKASSVATADMKKDMLDLYSKGEKDTTCVYGNEWVILTMARADELPKEWADAYYASVEDTVKSLKSAKLDSTYATTNAKVVLTLSAIGKNPSNVAGYNLLAPLADMNYINKQGVNAAIYALLAFDAKDYTIPKAQENEEQTTREALIQCVLDAELETGGWDWSGIQADPDFTAMAIQALTPYYTTNGDVKAAVDRGLQALSDIQNPDGSFSSWGVQNSCSTAQVLLALSGIGINPATDSRFIKNGYTIFQGLGDFYVAGSGFRYDFSSPTADGYSTAQVSQALVAYDRLINQEKSFYDMQDVVMESTEEETTEVVTEATTAVTENSTATSSNGTPRTGDHAPLGFLSCVAILAVLSFAATIGKKQEK